MTNGEYSFAKEFEAFLPKKKPSRVRPRSGQTVNPTDGQGMGAAVSVATYPPLGQVTQVASSRVTFYAVVEERRAESQGHDAPEVILWHSPTERPEAVDGEDGPEWTATAFEPIGSGDGTDEVEGDRPSAQFWGLQETVPGVTRHYYQAVVSTDKLLHFTVKFREGNSQSTVWRWVGDEQQIGDGTVVVNPWTRAVSIPLAVEQAETETTSPAGARSTASLEELIGSLNPSFRVTSPRSQSPNTQLWSLEVPVDGVAADADGTEATAEAPSTYTTVPIGTPWHGQFLRWFALVRIWTPWLAPRHGRASLKGEDLDDALVCSFLSAEGRHIVFLAISGVDHIQAVFHGANEGDSDEENNLFLTVRSDSLQTETATVLVAVGDSFETANAAVMYHARGLVHQMGEASHEAQAAQAAQDAQDITTLSDKVRPEWLENWYDGLGFCTWNGIGQNLSEDKIVAAVDALADHGIRISNLIIDDNWQSIDRSPPGGQFQYTWTRFEADAGQFPLGLKHAVHRIRDKHPSIQHIAVWHALLGYWGGITPAPADKAHGSGSGSGDEIAQTYATRVIDRAHPKRRNLPIAGPMTVVDEPDVRRFYNDFYAFLVDAGIDGVKTDAQFMVDTWTSAAARRSLTTTYQDAWTVATLRHFGSRAVSCMSQTPAILFYSQLPQNRPQLLVRNSDDFFPDVPASHPWHVWTNAHNSLFTQHLNVLPDWDMFQTVHGYSGFHAAARCVSGGPIYITDTPGKHDLGLIRQMTGETVYGKTVIFRPSVVGRSLDQYVGFHDNVLLKVGSFHGSADGTGILGVFNVSDRAVHEIVPLARIPGVVATADADSDSDSDKPLYVVRAHSSGHVTGTPVEADGALLTLSLDVYQYEIVSAYRVHSFGVGQAKPLHVANLGLVGKMAAAATVFSTSFRQRDDNGGRVEMQTSLKAPGVLGLYVSGLAEGRVTIKDHFLVTMRGLPIPRHCVAISAQDPHVLEIDTARAWTEMGFKPMMSNEVQLIVYISLE